MELGNEDLESKINKVKNPRRPASGNGRRGRKRGVEKMNLSSLTNDYELKEIKNTTDANDKLEHTLSKTNEIEIGDNELDNLVQLMENDEHENAKNNRSTSSRSSKRWSQEDQAIVLTDNEIEDDKNSNQVGEELLDMQPFAFDMIANDEYNYLIKNNGIENYDKHSHEEHKSIHHSHDHGDDHSDDHDHLHSSHSHDEDSPSQRRKEHKEQQDDKSDHIQDNHNKEVDNDFDKDPDIKREQEKEYEKDREKDRERYRERERERERDKERDKERDRYDDYEQSSRHHIHDHGYDSDDEDDYAKDMNKKRYLLGEIELFRPKYDFLIPKEYTLQDKLSDIEETFAKIDKRDRIDKEITNQKSVLTIFTKGVEYVNMLVQYMTGKGLQLDGWSDHLAIELEKHNDLFEELYKKHGTVITIPVEFKLAFIILTSGFAYHSNRADMQLSTSDKITNEVLNSDPELKRRYAEIYNQKLEEIKKRPPEQQTQSTGVTGMVTKMFTDLFGGTEAPTIRPDVKLPHMKQPRGMDDMVNNLKEETDIADISFTARQT